MTEMLKRMRRQSFPLWTLRKVRYHPKRGYEARVKVLMGESEWLRLGRPHIWVGKGEKKIRVTGKPEDVVDLIQRYDLVKVRIPALESKHKKEIRREQKKKYKKIKRWS